MTQVILMMSTDLANLERSLLKEVDELLERKKFREKMTAEAEHTMQQTIQKGIEAAKKAEKRRK